ncbi:FtsQ-type POTRA domain-containing protein [candidate division WWE3 bacterium]|uniref:FtsQ-type POTRA domain-containing protein n=1 Tax=candidate division WWE3 bacterium TaxID=2053526 RepID=A0A3A4ZMY6_UNCKA|nr:MAG: FtsQ-type POTRA domain-containing protein [candidate division WWE3 bacterium]
MRSLPTRKRKNRQNLSLSKVFLSHSFERNPRVSIKLRVILRNFLFFIKNLLPVLVVIALAYGLYYFAYKSEYFHIKDVQVQGTYAFVSQSDVYTISSNLLINQNILSIETETLSENLRKNFLGIKNLQIKKSYPNKILIIVAERVPIAQIKNIDTEGSYLIDADGYILGIVADNYSDLPLIVYDGEIFIGRFIDFNIVPLALEIINFSKSEHIDLSSMSFKGMDTTFYTNGKIETVMNGTREVRESMKIVSEIIENARTDGRTVKKIDLRYDKVIVLYD